MFSFTFAAYWNDLLDSYCTLFDIVVTTPTQPQHNLNLTQLSWVWHNYCCSHYTHPLTKEQGTKAGKEKREEQRPEQIAVLFCDYTKDGELANLLRELLQRMEGALGFSIKVVERTGPTLKNQFPVSNLWEEEHRSCMKISVGSAIQEQRRKAIWRMWKLMSLLSM